MFATDWRKWVSFSVNFLGFDVKTLSEPKGFSPIEIGTASPLV